jgi:hypothetical protein
VRLRDALEVRLLAFFADFLLLERVDPTFEPRFVCRAVLFWLPPPSAPPSSVACA